MERIILFTKVLNKIVENISPISVDNPDGYSIFSYREGDWLITLQNDPLEARYVELEFRSETLLRIYDPIYVNLVSRSMRTFTPALSAEQFLKENQK